MSKTCLGLDAVFIFVTGPNAIKMANDKDNAVVACASVQVPTVKANFTEVSPEMKSG